jgi:hypothetical protein
VVLAGNVLLDETFEEAPARGGSKPHHWWRSNEELCNWQNTSGRSGSGALQARLGFEIPRVERLNTRHGRAEDGLEVEPTQLGVFQADFPLERATSMVAAPMQTVIDPALQLGGKVEGWAACGVVGWDEARWTSLLDSVDQYGRLRGSAGALLRHYAGTWKGSSWAFFGVTNRDLFAPDLPALNRAFVDTIRALVRDIYLASLTTERSCYRRGERVKFFMPIFSGGRTEQDLRVELEIRPAAPNEGKPRVLSAPAARFEWMAHVLPHQTNLVIGEWTVPDSTNGFYHLIARLWQGTNEIDMIESGFLVWKPEIIRSGPKLDYRDNYLRFGQRPLFLFGTDDWGYTFNTSRETPLQWLRDMSRRRDLGVTIYENLQFGLPRSPEDQVQLLRKVDGIVQLTQEYGQVYFPGLLVGFNAASSNTDLAKQTEYCRQFARRYADVPGLIYYLNGDYRCELSQAVMPQWNQFLRERYRSDAALREAWGRFAPSQPLGQLPAEDYHDWEQTWDDLSAYDRNCFRAWLMRRWNGALISADPSGGQDASNFG